MARHANVLKISRTFLENPEQNSRKSPRMLRLTPYIYYAYNLVSLVLDMNCL